MTELKPGARVRILSYGTCPGPLDGLCGTVRCPGEGNRFWRVDLDHDPEPDADGILCLPEELELLND